MTRQTNASESSSVCRRSSAPLAGSRVDTVIAQTDDAQDLDYPSASVILIDDDVPQHDYNSTRNHNTNVIHDIHVHGTRSSYPAYNPAYVSPSSRLHDGQRIGYTDRTHDDLLEDSGNYATAQVVGTEISPFSREVCRARMTDAEAIPLDPWSKSPTVSTTMISNDSNTTGWSTRPNSGVGGVTQQDVAQLVPAEAVQPTGFSRPPPPPPPIYLPTTALFEDPAAKKIRRRRRRRSRMIVGGVTGFVAGTVVLGPLVGIAGAAAAVVVTRSVSKMGERRKDRRLERDRERLENIRSSLRRSGGQNGDVGLGVPVSAVPTDSVSTHHNSSRRRGMVGWDNQPHHHQEAYAMADDDAAIVATAQNERRSRRHIRRQHRHHR